MRNTPVTIVRRKRDVLADPQLKNHTLQALANRLDDVGQIDQYLVMALHVAHLDLAGGELVATQDQNELGANLVGLLKLSFERTTLVVGLGHDTCGAKLLRDGKDVLAQLLAGIGDVDARGLLGTQIVAKGLQGQQGALKANGKADARRGLATLELDQAVIAAAATDGADAGARGLDLKDSTGVVVQAAH